MIRSVYITIARASARVVRAALAIALGCLTAACGADAAAPAADTCASDTCGPCTGCGCSDTCPPQDLATQGVSTALVLPDGRLAITTWDDSLGALVVVFQRPGSSERVVRAVSQPGATSSGRWARIALETGGGLQVAWHDPTQGIIRWARGSERGFDAPMTVTTVAAASHLALEVDASDGPHLAFRDDGARVVRYAVRNGAGWTLLGVDGCAGEPGCPEAGGEDFGQGLDLALVTGAGSGALPRIAFYDAGRGDLKLAGLDSDGRWSTVTLDGSANGAGDVGRFVSLALTPTRSLGVAYFDATLGALRYLGPVGAPRVVDSGVVNLEDGRTRRLTVGQFCVLDFDSQGSAHILYVDSATPGLRHARVPGEGPAAITELAIPAGLWPSFEVVGERLVGAYGAFITGDAPRTELRLFDLSAGAGAE